MSAPATVDRHDPAGLDIAVGSAFGGLVRPLLALMQRLAGVETTFLTLIDWAAQEQDVAYALNSGETLVAEGTRVAWCDSLCRHALDTGLACSTDAQVDFFASPAVQRLGLRTFFALPVVVDGEMVGTVCGASRQVRDIAADVLEHIKFVGQAMASQIQLVSDTGAHLGLRRAGDAKPVDMSAIDPLTRLPNRALMLERLQQTMAAAQRQGRRVALCSLDLDGFGAVNDALGQALGNELLATAARRLRRAIRNGDTVARLGGDEFVLVLADIGAVSEVELVVNRVLQAMARPYLLDGQPRQLSASVGVALYPEHGAVPDQLLRCADQAMCRAKSQGRNRACLTGTESARPLAEQALMDEIATALAAGQLRLHYQPKVCARTRRVLGAEVLVRWQHPVRGLLPPGAFLPALLGTALEVQLDLWVMREALAQLARWHADGLPLTLSINVSPGTLAMPGLARTVADLVASAGMAPRSVGSPLGIELEVLETTALNDLPAAAEAINACAGQGISFALDDFGTGYSSLSYLRRLPVSTLKIDRSFVMNMLDSPDDRLIVQAVIGLAQAFGVACVAEGVESEAHAGALAQLGCQQLQGFGIARPMPAQEFVSWVARAAQADTAPTAFPTAALTA